MEMAPIKNPRHRFDVADVMAELSGFPPATLVSRALVMRMELEAVLDTVALGHSPTLSFR
jgi:hypothetical protein